MQSALVSSSFPFFFNHTAPTEIYTLSLHDALPICLVFSDATVVDDEGRATGRRLWETVGLRRAERERLRAGKSVGDRKSTRLNSSHVEISYAVFCLKKKKKTIDVTMGERERV